MEAATYSVISVIIVSCAIRLSRRIHTRSKFERGIKEKPEMDSRE